MSETATNKYELEEYTLGSGHLHFEKLKDKPTDWNSFMENFFASQTNLLGRIKGGASIEYTTEKTEDQDDLGYVVIEEIKSEKVILKSGMMTWNGETLAAICATARVKEDPATGIVTVKIGGLGNRNNDIYVIGFEHYSKKLRVLIIGKNNEGFTFSFEQDKATVIDVQFRAEALDSEGTLIILHDLRKAKPEVLAALLNKDTAASPAKSDTSPNTDSGTDDNTSETSDGEV